MALTRVHTDLIEGSLGGDASEELQVDTFVGDGTTVTFGLTRLPDHANNTQVYISGVYQQKDTYTVSGLDLTFSEAPAIGESIEAVVAYVNPMYSGDHVQKVQAYNPNILINPSFTVKQRGDVVDHIDNNSKFGPDRWGFRPLVGVGGAMSQSTTVVDPTTGINKLLVKHSNATSFAYTFQNIEAVNIQGLYGKEMTFSFGYSDVGGSGIPKVQIVSWNLSESANILYAEIPTSLGNNRWTCTITLSIDGTIPDPSELGMQVLVWPNEGNNAPNEWSVWETKLEVGSVATPCIARPYGEELSLCQRYYYSTAEYTQLYYTAASYQIGSTSQTAVVDVWFPVSMRTSPSLFPYTFTNLEAESETITRNRARLNGRPTNLNNCAKVESSLMFDAEL